MYYLLPVLFTVCAISCLLFTVCAVYYLCCFSLKHNPFGPLTQRLVSALIEENLATPLATATVDGEGISVLFAHVGISII